MSHPELYYQEASYARANLQQPSLLWTLRTSRLLSK